MSKPARKLVASIDQGTNTVRLLVVDAAQTPPKPLALEQRIVRLGGGFSDEGKITDAAIERAFAAQREYGSILRNLGCTDISAVGTGVLRQAPNASEFVELVRSEAGIPLEIISGEREAELSVLGALGALGVGAEDGHAEDEILWERRHLTAHDGVDLAAGFEEAAEQRQHGAHERELGAVGRARDALGGSGEAGHGRARGYGG